MVINTNIVPSQSSLSMAWISAKTSTLRVGDANDSTADDGLTANNIEPMQDVFHTDMDPEGSSGNSALAGSYQRRAAAVMLTDASTFNHTQQMYLDKVSQALKKMQDIAWRANDAGLSENERSKASEEFTQLAKRLVDIASRDYNGAKLFDGSSRQIEPLHINLEGVNLAASSYTKVVQSDVLTVEGAQQAGKTIEAALRQLTQDRQILESGGNQLDAAAQSVIGFTDNAEASMILKSAVSASEDIQHYSEQALLAQATPTLNSQRTLQLLWEHSRI